jgi:hypothetical protein
MMGLGSRAIPSLSPAVQAMLVHEREVDPQPEIVVARAMARARESLHQQSVVTFTPRRAPAPIRRVVFAAAAALVLTAGVAAAYQMLRISHPSSPEAGAGPALRARPMSASRQEPTATPAALATPMASPKPTARGDNQEELQFLLRARQADAHGDYAKVLKLLAQHQRGYPTGRLAEEREFLRVKALFSMGQKANARKVAGNFRQQFPRSVLLHKIDEMLTASR